MTNQLTQSPKANVLFLLTIFLSLSRLTILAQEDRFFMPLEIKQAYENGTRSMDGKPGDNYWQNTADYNIEVSIDTKENRIIGKEEVIYHNNSPEDLTVLVVRLYADVYKKGNARMISTKSSDIHDGVELSNIEINNEQYDLKDRRKVSRRGGGTNLRFSLSEPVQPGEFIVFNAEWEQQIPTGRSYRTGAYDSTSFFIAYWYPQIAVCDDIFGWDYLPFDLMKEFYNNLANFDVRITVPHEYAVWATGMLQNPDQVLPEFMFDRYKKALISEEKIKIIDENDLENEISMPHNEWHYMASDVTDFAFAMGNNYIWEATSMSLDDRNILINSVYQPDSTRDFSNHLNTQKKTLKHFSEDVPGIPYPYPAFTTFISKENGGMEYPMMANNNGPGRGVTVHEIFHTYFPMYVRTNEKRWAWMDEGWADYITALVEQRYFENDPDIKGLFAMVNPSSTNTMGRIADLPLITSSQFTNNSNYGYATYVLPSFVYALLHYELGEEIFLECFREYIKRWAKKAPTPYDFFYTFEDISGEDLSWIWKPWFFDFGYADVSINGFENGMLTIINEGGKPVPILTEVHYRDLETKLITESATVWSEGKKEYHMPIPDTERVKGILINTTIPDIDLDNNIYPSISSFYENFALNPGIIGDYKVTRFGFTLSLVEEDNMLYMDTPWGWHNPLYPIEEFHYSSLDERQQFIFSQTNSGEIIASEIIWFGMTLKMEKLKSENED